MSNLTAAKARRSPFSLGAHSAEDRGGPHPVAGCLLPARKDRLLIRERTRRPRLSRELQGVEVDAAIGSRHRPRSAPCRRRRQLSISGCIMRGGQMRRGCAPYGSVVLQSAACPCCDADKPGPATHAHETLVSRISSGAFIDSAGGRRSRERPC